MLDLKEGDVPAPVSEDFLTFKTALVVFREATRVMPGTVTISLVATDHCAILVSEIWTARITLIMYM